MLSLWESESALQKRRLQESIFYCPCGHQAASMALPVSGKVRESELSRDF